MGFGAELMGGVTATLCFEVLTRVRKFFDFAYVPIYFQFLPLDVLNADLAYYVGDDFWLGDGNGQRPTPAEAAKIKQRIQRRGALAVAVSSLVLPGVSGFAVAQYMLPGSLWYAMAGVAALLVFRMTLSVRGFRDHATVADRRTIGLLCTLYVVYAGVVLWVFRNTYLWTRKYVDRSDYSGLFKELTDFLIGNVIVTGVVVAVLATVFLKDLTDRHFPTLDNAPHDEDR